MFGDELGFYKRLESRTFPPDFPLRTSPDFAEQSCTDRSWTDEKSFYSFEAGLMKEFLVN